mmetsp:Transcript_47438/g.92581  ORF Transcript_47438/g.92581 Transcript_47438/m.92581 type:complete len:218 (-) Transcript_47438:264-917(-)
MTERDRRGQPDIGGPVGTDPVDDGGEHQVDGGLINFVAVHLLAGETQRLQRRHLEAVRARIRHGLEQVRDQFRPGVRRQIEGANLRGGLGGRVPGGGIGGHQDLEEAALDLVRRQGVHGAPFLDLGRADGGVFRGQEILQMEAGQLPSVDIFSFRAELLDERRHELGQAVLFGREEGLFGGIADAGIRILTGLERRGEVRHDLVEGGRIAPPGAVGR